MVRRAARSLLRSSAAVAAALWLVACGGGSSSGGGGGSALSATLTAPAALANNLAGTIELAASASGAVASVEFQVDGQPVGAPDTTAPYGASLDTTAFASGQHIVRARARDAAGNASAWSAATVRFGGREASADADERGRWRVSLPASPATAEPQELIIEAGEGAGRVSRTLRDVVIGEVWLCAGQSNMAMRLASVRTADQDAAAADQRPVRQKRRGRFRRRRIHGGRRRRRRTGN